MYVANALSKSEFREAQNQSLGDGEIRMLFLRIQFCDTHDSARTLKAIQKISYFNTRVMGMVWERCNNRKL